MDAKKFGKRVKIARIERDLTQDELAIAIEMKQKSISSYETGAAFPSLETLEKLSNILKKPISYFFED